MDLFQDAFECARAFERTGNSDNSGPQVPKALYEKVHTFARLLVAQKARTLQGNMQKHGSEAKEAQPAPGAETFEPSVPVIGTLEQFAQASFVLPPNYVAQLTRIQVTLSGPPSSR